MQRDTALKLGMTHRTHGVGATSFAITSSNQTKLAGTRGGRGHSNRMGTEEWTLDLAFLQLSPLEQKYLRGSPGDEMQPDPVSSTASKGRGSSV